MREAYLIQFQRPDGSRPWFRRDGGLTDTAKAARVFETYQEASELVAWWRKHPSYCYASVKPVVKTARVFPFLTDIDTVLED